MSRRPHSRGRLIWDGNEPWTSTVPLTIRTLVWILAGAAASVTVMLAVLFMTGHSSDSWLLCARYTARLSFVLFLISFLAPRWIPGFSDQDSRDAFLAFAAAHFGHLAALMTYLNVSGLPMNTGQKTIGALAYFVLAGLTVWLVSGKRFIRFHSPMVHYILLVMALTYGSRLAHEEARLVGLTGVAACLIALALRHVPASKPVSGG